MIASRENDDRRDAGTRSAFVRLERLRWLVEILEGVERSSREKVTSTVSSWDHDHGRQAEHDAGSSRIAVMAPSRISPIASGRSGMTPASARQGR